MEALASRDHHLYKLQGHRSRCCTGLIIGKMFLPTTFLAHVTTTISNLSCLLAHNGPPGGSSVKSLEV